MKKNLLIALAALLPVFALAQPGNDYCSGAVTIPVNPGTAATNFATGNFNDATLSLGVPNQCSGTAYNDVWYHFTAVSNMHLLTIHNITQVTALNYEIRSGSCSGNYFYCGTSDPDGELITFFVPGQEYYLRIYSQTATVPANTTFQVSLTSADPGITVSSTQYTVPQLVEDILAQPGLNISNITWSTGSTLTAGQPNGIGYFEQNGTNFPFEDGIILSTGNAEAAPGPNVSMQNGGTFSGWPGDTDLSTIFPGTSYNATSLEFNFVPNTDDISLNFIFASEEYGIFQCLYGDGMAILLTDVTLGTPSQNIAVIPNTYQPIGVQTIRNGAYSNGCPGVNTPFFGQYYEPFTLQGATNFNGHTVQFTAESAVEPGHTYHLKIVVADKTDPVNDSAIFLKGGSFRSGPAFDDSIITFSPEGPFVTCEYNPADPAQFIRYEVAATVVDNPANYTISWHESLTDAMGAANPLPLTFEMEGTEQVVYFRIIPNDSPDVFDVVAITLVADPLPDAGEPGVYILCDEDGVADSLITIDLNDYMEAILNGEDPDDVIVTFYSSFDDALQQVNPITTPESYITGSADIAFTAAYANAQNGCFIPGIIGIIVSDLPVAQITTANNVHSICTDANGQVTQPLVLQTGYNNTYSFVWYRNGQVVFSANGNVLNVTQPGNYSYTVFDGGCTSEMAPSFAVTLSGPAVPVGSGYTVNGQQITIAVEGPGEYIYSLSAGGPYDESNVLDAPGPGTYTAYVTDANGCGTTMITGIVITMPNAPQAAPTQEFEEGQTLADLNVQGENLQWYADAEGTQPLSPDTVLEDNVTYYVTQTVNGEESAPAPVSVYRIMGLDGNSLAALRCYPNPVTNELKLEHTATLLSATLYNTLGQEVLRAGINHTSFTLNLSGLSDGIYMMKVQAENGQRIIKIVKE